MIDLCWLLSQLTDNNGNILIGWVKEIFFIKMFFIKFSGLDKMVAELTKEESEVKRENKN